MTKMTDKSKTLAIGIAFGAIVTTTGVSAAGNAHELDDAIMDYNSGFSVSRTTSTYSTDGYQTAIILEEDYYDYTPRRTETLEEAEFAAFEVPEDLIVHD